VVLNTEGVGFGRVLHQVLDLRVKQVLFKFEIHVIDGGVFLVTIEIKIKGVDTFLCSFLRITIKVERMSQPLYFQIFLPKPLAQIHGLGEFGDEGLVNVGLDVGAGLVGVGFDEGVFFK
jgi:hypothetical protein